MAVRVQTEDFDAGAETRALQDDTVGAIALFIGTVRGLRSDNGVTAMTLEHYPGMTESELERIENEARARWPLEDVTIIHRVGRLLPSDQIVLVATSSAHRKAAFDATEFIMDFLKTDAPFWKAEERDGETSWVEARKSDDDARERGMPTGPEPARAEFRSVGRQAGQIAIRPHQILIAIDKPPAGPAGVKL